MPNAHLEAHDYAFSTSVSGFNMSPNLYAHIKHALVLAVTAFHVRPPSGLRRSPMDRLQRVSPVLFTALVCRQAKRWAPCRAVKKAESTTADDLY